MSRIIAILTLATLALSACAAQESEPTTTVDSSPVTVDPAGLSTYTSESMGFHIDYPSTWTVTEDIDNGIVTFNGPTGLTGYTDNFNVSVGEVGSDLPVNAYYQGEPGRLQSLLPGVEIIEQANVLVDGYPALGITVTSSENDIVVGISRLLVLRDGVAYEVTYTSTGEGLATQSPLVRTILSSFGFTG